MWVVGLPSAFYYIARHLPPDLSSKVRECIRWLSCWQALRDQGLSSTKASRVLALPRSTLYRWQGRLKVGGQRDWKRMVSFYDFPQEHWQHLRTTNPVESPFAALRLRTDAAKRYKRVDRATAVIWKMLLVTEKRFRRLNAPDLLGDIYDGAKYEDGIRVKDCAEGVA